MISNIIENKIINNDEIEYQIKKESEEEAKKLLNESIQLKQTMSEINHLLEKSGQQLKHIEDKTDESNENIKHSKSNIDTSHNYFKKTNLLKFTAISSVIGLCVGGPLGGVICNSIAANLVGIGIFSGSVIGSLSLGGTTYSILKQK